MPAGCPLGPEEPDPASSMFSAALRADGSPRAERYAPGWARPEESRQTANAAIPGVFINLRLAELLYGTKPLSKLHSTLGKQEKKKKKVKMQSSPFQGTPKQTGLHQPAGPRPEHPN